MIRAASAENTVTIFNLVYLVGAGVMTGLLAYKFRHLRSRWGSPPLWALCAVLAFGAAVFWFAAPTNLTWINRVTGVPNFSAPLIYSCGTATAASLLALALFWRYPVSMAWPSVRWTLVAYASGIAAGIVLFAVSSVPEERPLDFAYYYAGQPTIAAMVLISLVMPLAGWVILAYWCFTWARHPDYADLPWLRRGLRLYGVLCSVRTLYCVIQLVVMIANWLGVQALNSWGRAVPLFSVPATILLLAAALIVPVWGPRWPAMRRWASRWRLFLLLRPLHRSLGAVEPGAVMVSPGKRLDPHHRVRRMAIELSDWHWRLAPLFTAAIGETAERLGREAGMTGRQLSATVEAAQLKAASRAWQRGERSADGLGPTTPEEDPRDGTGVDSELTWWLEVARAFDSSVVVDAVAQARAATTTATTEL